MKVREWNQEVVKHWLWQNNLEKVRVRVRDRVRVRVRVGLEGSSGSNSGRG